MMKSFLEDVHIYEKSNILQPAAFSTQIVVVLLYFFFNLWEYRIINLSCFCTHEKVFLFDSLWMCHAEKQITLECAFLLLELRCDARKNVHGEHSSCMTFNLSFFPVTLKTIAFVHELQSDRTFYFILYAFVA